MIGSAPCPTVKIGHLDNVIDGLLNGCWIQVFISKALETSGELGA